MEARERWGSKSAFILSSIGSAIGFGNIWRFPMLVYEYGGGAFLVPYLLALAFTAIPIVVLEFGLGQFLQQGHVRLCTHLSWRAAGVGWGTIVGTFFIAQYYLALLAYCLIYLLRSLSMPIPCSDVAAWGKETDVASASGTNYTNNASNTNNAGGAEINGEIDPMQCAAKVFQNDILHQSESIRHTGGLVPQLVLAYFLLWGVVFVGVSRGPGGIGMLNKLLMPVPFVVLCCFLAKGAALDGATHGLRVLFDPDFRVLYARPDIWTVAVSQIFFGVSAALGTLTTYASFNPKSTPIVRSAVVVCVSNSFFSLLAAVVIFSYLGHLSTLTGTPITKLATSGPALAFEVFPTAIALMPYPRVWATAFFLMLLNLGLSSAVSMTSPLTLALEEALSPLPGFEQECAPPPQQRNLPVTGGSGSGGEEGGPGVDSATAQRQRRKRRMAFIVHLWGFVTGLLYVTRAGIYWLELADHFLPMFVTIAAGMAECVLVSVRYGHSGPNSGGGSGKNQRKALTGARLLADQVCSGYSSDSSGSSSSGSNDNSDIGFKQQQSSSLLACWWAFSWSYLLPVVLGVLLVGQLVSEGAHPFGGYPAWAVAFGWLLGLSPLFVMLLFWGECWWRQQPGTRTFDGGRGGSRDSSVAAGCGRWCRRVGRGMGRHKYSAVIESFYDSGSRGSSSSDSPPASPSPRLAVVQGATTAASLNDSEQALTIAKLERQAQLDQQQHHHSEELQGQGRELQMQQVAERELKETAV